MVVLGTEFGRMPRINDNDGRDKHDETVAWLLVGGGMKGWKVEAEMDGWVRGSGQRKPG